MFDRNCITLSELETDLVSMYRLLHEGDKAFVFDLVHHKYTRLVSNGETTIRLMNVYRHEQAAKGQTQLSHLRHGT